MMEDIDEVFERPEDSKKGSVGDGPVTESLKEESTTTEMSPEIEEG